MLKYRFILTIVISCIAGIGLCYGQADRHDVRKGNREFKKENYRESQIDYSKALIKDSTSFAANYNLGNTLYRQDDAEQARKSYEKLQDEAAYSSDGASLYYNMGNAAVAAEDWQGAVDAYKNSLLMNPGDMDAKENYIYAKSKLQEQENQDQNQDQDGGGGGGGGGNDQDQDQNQDQNNDQNQDQNQDQGGGDQNQDQNQDQDQNQGGGGDQEQNQDQQQQPQQQPNISPQQAAQMLQAIQAKENETQDKVNKEKAEMLKRRQKEKNW